MVPDYEANECAQAEEDRVIRFIARMFTLALTAGTVVALLLAYGCSSVPVEPCITVVVAGHMPDASAPGK